MAHVLSGRGTLRRIHIMLAALPPMLREIVAQAVERESDMEIGEVLENPTDLSAAVRRHVPDIVLIGLDAAEFPAVRDELVRCDSSMKLFAVSTNVRNAFLCEMRPQTRPLGELAPDDLISEMRRSVEPVKPMERSVDG